MTPKLAKKLASLINSLEALRKSKSNPFYKSKYADINQLLEQVKPLLADSGLTILQPIIDDQVVTIITDEETGETFPDFKNIEEMKGLRIVEKKPQDKGSEITYYRRYGLQSLLLLQAIDDDANATVPGDKQKNFQEQSGKSHKFKAKNEDFDFGL